MRPKLHENISSWICSFRYFHNSIRYVIYLGIIFAVFLFSTYRLVVPTRNMCHASFLSLKVNYGMYLRLNNFCFFFLLNLMRKIHVRPQHYHEVTIVYFSKIHINLETFFPKSIFASTNSY
jgi:hypothetical protein